MKEKMQAIFISHWNFYTLPNVNLKNPKISFFENENFPKDVN